MSTLIATVFSATLSLGIGNTPSFLEERLVWLPMTGATDAQIAEAAQAGFDTVLWKVGPRPLPDGSGFDMSQIEDRLARARRHGLKSIFAIVGEAALGSGTFYDVDEDGNTLPNQLDPFWPQAMERIERMYSQVIDRYHREPDVIAFAPTWGIYGEAGFVNFKAGRSGHALARFNEWCQRQGLAPLDAVPTRHDGPNTEYNRFIRFRYVYMEEHFDGIITRLKTRAGGKPVGTWQELYPIVGYLWTMVKVPSADFALYESCFTYQTSHDPERTLAETMGFRYRCDSPESYRDYYLPILARKRGEGQRFMGCQLSDDYAINNYGWSPEKTEAAKFDAWEDHFAPYLRKLHDAPVEDVTRDVLLVFPTYAAAALSGSPAPAIDTKTIDVLLRMFGCQIRRPGSPEFDKMTVADMDRYRIIIVPAAEFILSETLERLAETSATVLFTGSFGQSLDAEFTPPGRERRIGDMYVRYLRRPAGEIEVVDNHALTRDLDVEDTRLPQDEAFEYVNVPSGVRVLLRSEGKPLLSTARDGRCIFLHGQLFAGLAYDPNRKPRALGGSADPSADEVDMWGPYCSDNPANRVGQQLMKNILDHAGVDYRVPDPKPRTFVHYLGDHMEQASVSANIAYNNTDEPQELRVRLPYRLKDWPSEPAGDRFEANVTVPPYGYIVLEPERTNE